jgi:hypothetical protein
MSLAEATREAVRERPFLALALRAGVVNYSAAAGFLVREGGVDGDREAVATALRRFADDLPAYATDDRRVRVRMRRGVGLAEGNAETALLSVGDRAVVPEGEATALVATGDVDGAALAAVLARLDGTGADVVAAGVAGEELTVVVEGRATDALRAVEAALSAVPA